MTEIELQIVNATALDPGKVYLIEVDRLKISPEQQSGLAKALTALGIKWVIVRSIGGEGIRICGPETEEKCMTEPAIDTTNKFLVTANTAGEFIIYHPPLGLISKQDALVLAAYIVSMSNDDDLWQRTLAAVQNT